MTRLLSIEDRIEIIRQLPATGEKTKLQWPPAPSIKEFDQFRIPIEVLVFRADNFRIRVELLEIQKNSKRDLRKDQETQSAQDELFALLLEQAQTSEQHNVVKKLRRDAVQTEPLIVTHSGVVVNGNRRLAAMRFLYEDDQAKFSSFKNVNCIVLPENTTEDELRELENMLQATISVREPYTWIAEALLIEDEKLSLQWTHDRIAAVWNLKKSDVGDILLQLALVRKYLEYIGRDEELSLALNDKQSFKTLAKKWKAWNNNPSNSEELKNIRLAAAWKIISHNAEGHNKHSYINMIEDVADQIVRATPAAGNSQVAHQSDNDPFGTPAVAGSPEVKLQEVARVIDGTDADDFASLAKLAREKAKEERMIRDRGGALAKITEDAVNQLRSATVDGSNERTHLKVLENCAELATRSIDLISILANKDSQNLQFVDSDLLERLVSAINEVMGLLDAEGSEND